MQNAAMLWTGGKDSSMALYEANQNGYCVRCLVTFAPPEPNFLAHPLSFIKMQAQALALPHYVCPSARRSREVTRPAWAGYAMKWAFSALSQETSRKWTEIPIELASGVVPLG